MRTKTSLILRRTAFAILGALYGYSIWVQILPLPDAFTNSLMQGATSVLKATTETFALGLPEDLMLAFVSFASAIPHIFFFVALAGVTVRYFGHQRLLIYSVLVWPVILHALHWLNVWYLEHTAMQTGMNPALATYRENFFFPPKALAILFIYSLFFVLAYFIMRIVGPSTHNPPLNTDAPPNGGAPVS